MVGLEEPLTGSGEGNQEEALPEDLVECPLDEATSGSTVAGNEPPVPPETSTECREEVEGADDVFSEAEWQVAQAKLEAVEGKRGLPLFKGHE